MSVLARRAGARLVVVDCGVAEPLPVAGVLDRRIGPGTASMLRGAGDDRASRRSRRSRPASPWPRRSSASAGVVALGEMGIGNSTSAAALTCALTGADPAVACGRGTGLDDEGLARKVAVVAGALERNVRSRSPRTTPSASWLRWAASSSACSPGSRSARRGATCPCSSTATRPRPPCSSPPPWRRSCRRSLIAAHRSSEPGHRIVLEALGLQPLLDLELRLGEGSGAALALPLLARGAEDPRRDGDVRIGRRRRQRALMVAALRSRAPRASRPRSRC